MHQQNQPSDELLRETGTGVVHSRSHWMESLKERSGKGDAEIREHVDRLVESGELVAEKPAGLNTEL